MEPVEAKNLRARARAPVISVITGPNDRRSSVQVLDARPSRAGDPAGSVSSAANPPLRRNGLQFEPHRNDIAVERSINFKINDNKNNMKSVKIRLALGKNYYFEYKGIEYPIRTICSMFGVPRAVGSERSDAVVLQRSESIEMTCDVERPGAFLRFHEEDAQSCRTTSAVTRIFELILNPISSDRHFGDEPKSSIPVSCNAINVQGIVYGHPHLRSFNSNFMCRDEAVFLLRKNKSDYVFIDTRNIVRLMFEREARIYRILNQNSDRIFGEEEYSELDRYEKYDRNFNDDNAKNDSLDLEHQPYVRFKNGELTFKSLLKIIQEAPSKITYLLKKENNDVSKGWNMPKMFRLAGGGESSLNAASGWGSPPNANNNNGVANNWGSNSGSGNSNNSNNNVQQQWTNTNQRPPGASTDVNTSKVGGTTSSTGNNSVSSSAPSGNWSSSNSNSTIPASSQPNNTSQAIPPVQVSSAGNNSPSSSGTGSLPPNSASSTVSGTPAPSSGTKAQLEHLSTLRESLFSQEGWGGQHVNQDTNWDVPTSPEPGVKHDQPGGPPVWKPNINNGTDLWEANLRNGGQPPPQPVSKTPWGRTPTTNIGGTWGEDDDTPESSNVWTGPPPPQQWGGPPQQQPHWNAAAKKDDWGGWGEHRPDIHRTDMHARDLRAPAPDHRDMRAMMGMDARGDMRGDPRGISGRLNGTADMWGQHHMPHGMQAPNKMMPTNVGNGVSQWSAQGPKDMGMAKTVSGWEEPSPPAARRNMPNFDDGTSLWGQQRGAGVGVGPWKDMPGGLPRGAMQCPPVMPPNRMPGVAPNPMKPDGMWGHPHRNGSWEDNSARAGNWDKEGVNSWNEGPMNQTGGWVGPKTKPMGGPGGSWDADMGDWGGPKPPVGGPSVKLLPKDVIWNSKQFRVLVDMGYKKDDVEYALRSRDMNVEEAMDLLSQMRGSGGMDTWRRHEEHPGGPSFEHQQQYSAPPHHQPPLIPPPQHPPSVPFPQPGQGLATISNISPAIVQKILNQPTSQPPPPFSQQNSQSGGSSQPSTAQLRMLVQQIQMAVSAGYLNHQILNQPLAPQTLVLLNQLLQQIKGLQQLTTQHNAMQNSSGTSKSNVNLHITMQISKTKQQITYLQNQIAAQQAIYIKQQQGNAAGGSASGSTGGDFFNKPPDPLAQIPNIQSNFADLNLNKDTPPTYGSSGGQQSRLNQWKLPSLDKEEGSEFSRAPGTTTKPNSSPQLNPLNLQPDSTWSSGRSVNDGWPTSDATDLPDGKETWPSTQPPQTSTYTDLVPEFEPGKPWKGNQIKSIEDDPAITPGSVVRSPISYAAIKDTDIFGTGNQGKASPTTPSERSLSSSTWSYPPPASTPSSFNIVKGTGSKSSWGDTPTTGASELWGSGSITKSRGQLPVSSTSKPVAPWGGTSSQPQQQSYTQQPNWQSTWLLLRNLTAQIDGSTLKTLCMQHGPLQSFHLYLNQGIALTKYSTAKEAGKAQTALNNCVLGNTTIFAESPAESDVNMILQHLGQGAGGGQWRNSSSKGASGPSTADTWSIIWDTPEQRVTPSSLTTFLPNDLLGGESI